MHFSKHHRQHWMQHSTICRMRFFDAAAWPGTSQHSESSGFREVVL